MNKQLMKFKEKSVSENNANFLSFYKHSNNNDANLFSRYSFDVANDLLLHKTKSLRSAERSFAGGGKR